LLLLLQLLLLLAEGNRAKLADRPRAMGEGMAEIIVVALDDDAGALGRAVVTGGVGLG